MNIEFKSITGVVSRGTMFLRRHIHALLFVWLIVVIGVWGFIFWQYGYLVVFQQIETTNRPLIIKEKELNALLEKARIQDEFRTSIAEKAFPNPFIKFSETQ